jgi:hypothetical protein
VPGGLADILKRRLAAKLSYHLSLRIGSRATAVIVPATAREGECGPNAKDRQRLHPLPDSIPIPEGSRTTRTAPREDSRTLRGRGRNRCVQQGIRLDATPACRVGFGVTPVRLEETDMTERPDAPDPQPPPGEPHPASPPAVTPSGRPPARQEEAPLPQPLGEASQELAEAEQRLKSEEIVIASPFSYAGSTERIWKMTRRDVAQDNPWAKVGLITVAVLLVAGAWLAVTGWYMIWGLVVVPYRLIRRGQRKRKLDAARHRELLEGMQSRKD